jgi:hypothetical protein
MAIKGVSITITYTAWDTANQVGRTADAGNHTLRIVRDGNVAVAPTNAPAEVDATWLKGEYKITLTAAEMTADVVTLGGISNTAGVVIIPQKIITEHGVLPQVAAGAQNGLPILDANLGVKASSIQSGIVAADTWNAAAASYNAAASMGAYQNLINSRLDVAISTRSTFAAGGNVNVSSVTSGIVAADVWGAAASGYNAASTMGAFQNLINTRLDVAISTRSTFAAGGNVNVNSVTSGIVAADVWNAATATYNAAGSMGNKLGNLTGSAPTPLYSGTVGSVTSATVFNLDAGASANTDIYKGMTIRMASGSNLGQQRTIVGYTSGRQVTLDWALPFTPVTGQNLEMREGESPALTSSLGVSGAGGGSDPWVSLASSYVTTGTMGQVMGLLNTMVGKLTFDASNRAKVYVDAFTAGVGAAETWGAVAASYVATGSMGQLQNRLDAAISTRSTFAAGGNVNVNSVTAGVVGADVLATPSIKLATGTGGAVTVGTNNDKAGYSGTITGAQATILTNLDATRTHLDNMIQTSGANYQFTALALALAPTGTGGGAADPWLTNLSTYGPSTAGNLLYNMVTSVAAAILATPANKLATDPSGNVNAILTAAGLNNITIFTRTLPNMLKYVFSNSGGDVKFNAATNTGSVTVPGDNTTDVMTFSSDPARTTRTITGLLAG